MWFTLNDELLMEAFQPTELDNLLSLRALADPVPGICKGLAGRIRAAVLANGRSDLRGGECDIPQALRGEAVAILRMKVLTRFNINASEDRRREATEAEERLRSIERGETPLTLTATARRPTYHARPAAYRQGAGIIPGSHRYPDAMRAGARR